MRLHPQLRLSGWLYLRFDVSIAGQHGAETAPSWDWYLTEWSSHSAYTERSKEEQRAMHDRQNLEIVKVILVWFESWGTSNVSRIIYSNC